MSDFEWAIHKLQNQVDECILKINQEKEFYKKHPEVHYHQGLNFSVEIQKCTRPNCAGVNPSWLLTHTWLSEQLRIYNAYFGESFEHNKEAL